jgi:UPF0755 protein
VFGKRSDQPRTAEDRARAAANRAARRAGRPLPAEAFEHSVRPPDVEPHEPLRQEPVEEPVAWEEPAAPTPSFDEPVAPRREFDDAAPAGFETDAAEPGVSDPAPREAEDEAALRPEADEPVSHPETDEAPPHPEADEPVSHPEADEPVSRPEADEAAPHPEADEAVPLTQPDAVASQEPDTAPTNGSVVDDAARAAAAAEARALRDRVGDAQPREEAPREDSIHQPTVEYSPFQTDEHALPEAPLGEPHEDEPRLVAARGFPSEQDEVHAFAASRPDTAEHEAAFDTGEHHSPEETEVRSPVPLRKAPARPADAGTTPRRAAPNAPRGRSRPPKTPKGPRGAAHWGRRIFTLLVVLVFVAVLYTFNKTFQPFHGDGTGSAVVNIPQNTDAAAIAKLLEAKGVIDSARFFELRATIGGERGDLRPGHYTLKKGMSNGAVITALTKVPANPKAAPTVDVTIIEGPSIKENDPVVKKSEKVDGSYAKAASSSAVLKRIRALGAPKGTKTAEGFLFPATYKLKVGAPASELVNEQLDAFEDNFKQIDMKYAKSKKLTRYDVLIIASMIEREAQLARERPLVSAVIYNRLKQGMPLGIDATTRYSINDWNHEIPQSAFDKDEPYNTRLNRGLPPTPIGNPGLASLKAAAKPSSKKYLFYVRKPGKSGAHAFSTTDAQFEKDVAKYNDSRKK